MPTTSLCANGGWDDAVCCKGGASEQVKQILPRYARHQAHRTHGEELVRRVRVRIGQGNEGLVLHGQQRKAHQDFVHELVIKLVVKLVVELVVEYIEQQTRQRQ